MAIRIKLIPPSNIDETRQMSEAGYTLPPRYDGEVPRSALAIMRGGYIYLGVLERLDTDHVDNLIEHWVPVEIVE